MDLHQLTAKSIQSLKLFSYTQQKTIYLFNFYLFYKTIFVNASSYAQILNVFCKIDIINDIFIVITLFYSININKISETTVNKISHPNFTKIYC